MPTRIEPGSQQGHPRLRYSSLGVGATVLAVVLTGVAAPAAEAYQPGDMVYERQLGADVQFGGMVSPAVDPTTGNVVVADIPGDRVMKLDGSGKVVLTIGGEDVQPQLLVNPYAVAVDAQGNIFVADSGHDRICKFNGAGKLLKSWGGLGVADGKFDDPRGLAVDADGFVYVSDTVNHRVQKFDNEGTWKATWGKWGSGNLEFKYPMGLGLTPSGDLAVADAGNGRIQTLKSDGTFVMKFGSLGTAPGQFSSLFSVATDLEGRFYTSDTQNPRVTVFAPWGALLGQREFLSSDYLAIDAGSGRLFVGGTKAGGQEPGIHVYRSAVAAEFTGGPKTAATAGKAYASTLQTSGFPAVSHVELAAGVLPVGLKIVGNKITGVPTKPGSYPVVLRADNAVTPSGWGAYTITIGKASSRVTAKFSTKKPRAAATRIKARIKLSAPYTTGLSKTGKVQVYYGKKRVKTYTVKASKNGVIKVKLPKFTKKGKTKVTLKYLGNSQLKQAKRTVTVRVR